MTQIAELFVALGVKGSDKTLGAIADTKKGLGDLKDTSFEAKAAIIGAMYALERLFSTSGHAGTELTNFNALMGGGMVQTLQRYQYAARQVGVSNQEVEGSFKTLQGAMAKIQTGQAPPAGMQMLSDAVGGISADDVDSFAAHPELLLQKLQEFTKHSEIPTSIMNEVMKSFGISDSMIAALKRQAFTPDVLAKAPTYSDKEVSALDKANVAWSNLSNKIEMAVGHFNALHGGQLVGDISKLTDHVIKLAEAFVKFADKVKLFDWIGKAFQGWELIFDAISDHVNDISAGIDDMAKALAPVVDVLGRALTGDDTAQKDVAGGAAEFATKDMPNFLRSLINDVIGPAPQGRRVPSGADVAAPRLPAVAPSGTTQHIDVKQTLNFNHDGHDSRRTAEDTKKAVNDAYRQQAALSGGP